MEGTLPFEYGYLYKVIELKEDLEISPSDKSQLLSINTQEGVITGTQYNEYYKPRVDAYIDKYCDHFNPIGYDPRTQKVILESKLIENQSFKNMVGFSNNQISSDNIFQTRTHRVYRIEVDVNIFIKYFEKVL